MKKAGPSLPAHILAAREARKKKLENQKQQSHPQILEDSHIDRKAERVVGPTLPANVVRNEDSSDDEEDIGPVPPPGPDEDAEAAEEAARRRLERFKATEIRNSRDGPENGSKREEWMLVPPSSEDWANRVDPTKLKNRQFLSGRNALAGATSKPKPRNWTETENERRKRLADEMMGLRSTDEQGNEIKPEEMAKREAEKRRRAKMEAEVESYTDVTRGESLYEKHAKKSKKDGNDGDDVSKRMFDRERDMGGGQIGKARVKEMVKKAGDIDSRFEKSSSYL